MKRSCTVLGAAAVFSLALAASAPPAAWAQDRDAKALPSPASPRREKARAARPDPSPGRERGHGRGGRGSRDGHVGVVLYADPGYLGGYGFPGYPCDPGPCDGVGVPYPETYPAPYPETYPRPEAGGPLPSDEDAYGSEVSVDTNAPVEFHIDPASARVSVDGIALGAASEYAGPRHLLWLPPGVHELVFEAEGYRTLATTVEVAGGEPRIVRLSLERLERGAEK